MSRVELAMNGTRPLADTASGAAGEVTGTERAKLQGMDSTKLAALGTIVSSVLGADILLTGSYQGIVNVSLPVGTHLIVGAFLVSQGVAGTLVWRIRNVTDNVILASGTVSLTGTYPIHPSIAVALAGTKVIGLEARQFSGGAAQIVRLDSDSQAVVTYIQGVRMG